MQKQVVRYLILTTLWVLFFPVIYIVMAGALLLGIATLGHIPWVFVIAVPLSIFLWLAMRRLRRLLEKTEEIQSVTLRLLPWFVPLFYTLSLVVIAYFTANMTGVKPERIIFSAHPWNWPFFLLQLYDSATPFIVIPLIAATIS